MSACPLCGGGGARDRGPILHYQPHKVAGVPIDLAGIDFRLRECPSCKFNFKDPPIPEQKLLDCYARADEANWGLDPDPQARYFDLLKHMAIEHAPGRRVLDIGCFNGALLSYLGDDWQKFGVEPSERAAALARQRGVTILGPTIDQIPPDMQPFDVILAIDVIEHIVDPLPFFTRVRDLLRPGGIFIALTGDTDAGTWRWHGNLYWYCSLPEHVSFYCDAAMQHIGRTLGMRSLSHQRIPHQRCTLARRAGEAARNIFFLAGTKTRWLGIPPLQKKFRRCGPMWLSAADHMLHIMQRL